MQEPKLSPLVLATMASQALLVALSTTIVAIGRDLGAPVGAVGQARSVAAAVAILASLAVFGRMDALGVRLLLGVGSGLAIVACAAVALAPTLALFLVAHLLVGLAFACLVSAGFAGVAAFAPERRPWAIGYVAGANALAWIVVNPLVGAIAEWLSWRAAQVVPAAVAVAALLTTRASRLEPHRPAAPPVTALLREPSARRWLGAEVIAYGAWTAVLTFVGGFFIERLGVSQFSAGWMLAAGAAAHFTASSRSGTLVALISRRRLAAGSALIMAILFYVLLGLTASAPLGLAAFCLVALAAGVRSPASSGLGLEQMPRHPGAMMAARTAATQFGYLLGAVIGGAVISDGGYRTLGIVLALGMAGSALLILRVDDRLDTTAGLTPQREGSGKAVLLACRRMITSRTTSTSRPTLGVFGRLGRWSARRRRTVFLAWAVLIIGLGAVAPRVEHALSGGGWQADGSQSVVARGLIDRYFGGQGSYALAVVLSSPRHTVGDPAFRRAIATSAAVLRHDPAVAGVQLPRPGESISRDGHVAVVQGGAGAGTAEMVRAAGRVQERLDASAQGDVQVALTGSAALWSQFNDENKAAMLRSEITSWPLTLAVLLVAFGSAAAAGIPLLLSILGLVAAAGALWIGSRLTGITIWAMNFALMFALAVGIDYALFVVVRFRAALRAGRHPLDAVGETMDSAGKAVLVSGLAVLASLSAVMLVPSQPFRTSVFGILLAVGFVLAASLTLLPAVLMTLGGRIDRFALPWVGSVQHRSEAFARWGRLIWRRPVLVGALAAGLLLALALPVTRLHTAMPNARVLTDGASARIGYERLERGFGPGAPSQLQVVVPSAALDHAQAVLRLSRGVAAVSPPERAGSFALVRVQPASGDPGGLIERLRRQLPAGTRVGGAAAEAHDLQHALRGRTPLVYAVVLTVGFVLLLTVVRAPLAAGAAVLLNLLATAAAFGAAKLIFQDGVVDSLLGFKSQGFVDAWAPVFFFCLSFALAMDYTVFLLTSVRAEFERTGDAREALVEGLARSGRVINAAGAVMIVVFFTFGLSGPLPPKEMGVILGVAVLLDTMLVRLLLLPAVLRLLGERAWWVPSHIERWLPAIGLRHAEPETPSAR